METVPVFAKDEQGKEHISKEIELYSVGARSIAFWKARQSLGVPRSCAA